VTKYNAAQLKTFVKLGIAMPGGRYPVKDAEDLGNAIQAVGETVNSSGEGAAEEVRRHIMARAKALHLEDKIPDTWNSDGSLKHEDSVEAFLAHHGVLGMKWGHRKASGGSVASTDHTRAADLQARAKSGGTKSLSNEELRHLTERLRLEGQYSQLIGNQPGRIERGHKFVKTSLGVVKTGVDAVNTGKQAYDATTEVRKLITGLSK
jgi:hypothetical protein